MEKIIIKRNFARLCGQVAIFSVIAYWFSSTIVSTGVSNKFYAGVMTLVGVLGVLFFGKMIILLIYYYIIKKPLLIIDIDGFTDYESNLGFINWSDVQSITVVTQRILGIDRSSLFSLKTTINIKVNNRVKPITLRPSLKKEELDDIAETMRTYRNASTSK